MRLGEVTPSGGAGSENSADDAQTSMDVTILRPTVLQDSEHRHTLVASAVSHTSHMIGANCVRVCVCDYFLGIFFFFHHLPTLLLLLARI